MSPEYEAGDLAGGSPARSSGREYLTKGDRQVYFRRTAADSVWTEADKALFDGNLWTIYLGDKKIVTGRDSVMVKLTDDAGVLGDG
jgi:hypothetical protein